MINWLKTLWKDLGDLSKPQFFLKYLLPGLAIFFLWGSMGHVYDLTLNTDSLIKNSGQVTDIAVKFEQGTKSSYKYYPLKIELDNYSEEFRLRDVFKTHFYLLQDSISVGDTITIYTRHKWQTILGWGIQNDIYQIDKNGQALFHIVFVRDETKSQAKILTIIAIILSTWYIIYRKNRDDRSKAAGNKGFAKYGR